MNESEKIRKQVSESYARAVTATTKSGCCGGPAPKGVTAKLAGYSAADLNELPAEAVVNSFGCGDPVALSGIKPGDTVVDLGSGAGIDILLAAKKAGPGGRVIGIDMTDEMIAKAKVNIAESGLSNVEVRKGIIEELPVESSSVDWVISNCVINLSPDKPKVFAEVARVLRPGGRMLVSDIVVEDMPPWLRQNALLYSSCVAGAISESEYLEGLRAAGMTDVKVVGRIVYEGSQLKALVDSEASCATGCCGGDVASADKELIEKAVPALAGKIASVKVSAKKA
jgi:arsenite methyltransferase